MQITAFGAILERKLTEEGAKIIKSKTIKKIIKILSHEWSLIAR